MAVEQTLEMGQIAPTVWGIVRHKGYARYDPAYETDRPDKFKIRIAKDGGMFSSWSGHAHEFAGFPDPEAVERADTAKKMLIGWMRGFKSILSGNRVMAVFFVLLFRKQLEASFEGMVVSAWKEVRPYLLADLFWCQSVRDINRAWHTVAGEETYQSRRYKHLVLTILQYDDAYRFRFQRMMEDMDTERFQNNPFRELRRIVALAKEREQSGRLQETWRIADLFLRLVRFHPLRKSVISFFATLDIEQQRLTEDDKYWAHLKVDVRW